MVDYEFNKSSDTYSEDDVYNQGIKYVYTDHIIVGDAKINTALIEELVVGTNVQMGANAIITWGQVSDKPFIPQTAADLEALATDSPILTYIDSTGVYTGQVVTNQLVAGTAKISAAMIENLVVGTNVTMGANATISWTSQVTGKPFIPSTAYDVGARPNTWTPSASEVGAISSTYIDGNGVWTGYLNADRITAGTISGNRITGGTIVGSDWMSTGTGTPFKVYIGNSSYLSMQVYNGSMRLAENGIDYFVVNKTGAYLNGSPLGGGVAKFG